MNYFLFLLGEIGIIVEIVGAGCLVFATYKTKQRLQGKSHTIDAADVIESTLDELKGQYKTELVGFCILLIGLILQFVGGLKISNSNLAVCFYDLAILHKFLLCFLIFILGNILIRKIYSFLRNNYVIKNAKNVPYQRAVALLGYLESFTYACAYYLGHYQFIVVWLGIKGIGRWSSNGPGSVVDLIVEIKDNELERRERKNAEINIYLIGNLLSIILAVMIAEIFKYLK